VLADLSAEAAAAGAAPVDAAEVNNILFDIEAKIVRTQILDGEPRIDGRDTRHRSSDLDPYLGCCHAPTVRRCSPAVKRRRWWLPPWAPHATARRSMR